jgi:hypothetical protein
VEEEVDLKVLLLLKELEYQEDQVEEQVEMLVQVNQEEQEIVHQ